MSVLEDFFSKDSVSAISSLVENKMPILNKIPDFKEKDKAFALATEDFENSLSTDLRMKFDALTKLNYQLDEYYLTLAYFIGNKQLND